MSSLAASRADNFYYPPDWRPEYGGISKYQGNVDSLDCYIIYYTLLFYIKFIDRITYLIIYIYIYTTGSKGANQYQQSGVIRFELPFDGW